MPSSSKEKKKSTKEDTKKSSSRKESSKDRKSKRRNRSKSPSRSRRERDDRAEEDVGVAQATQRAPPPPPPGLSEDNKASSDFEAGLLFERFAQNGGMNAMDFQRMWRERESVPPVAQEPQGGRPALARDGVGADKMFEFGQLFGKFDADGDGKLGRAEFERMMGGMLDEIANTSNKGATTGTSVAKTETAAAADTGDAAPVQTAGTDFMSSARDFPRPAGALAPAREQAAPISVARSLSITHYDETTGVPLAREAVASQQALGHTVVLLTNAYTRRLSRLQTLTSSRLMPVREQLLQQRRRYRTRADEVKGAKATIERETMADAGAIVERLRSVEALKQATLAQGVSDVTAELESVEKISEEVHRLSSLDPLTGSVRTSVSFAHDLEGGAKMIELIQVYPELCGAINRLADKPLEMKVDVRSDDLPNETAERLEVLRRADRYEQALAVKDHMLWTVIQESQGLEDMCEQERTLGHEFAEEAQEWVAIAGRLSDDLNSLRDELAQAQRLREANASLTRDNAALARRLEALERKGLTCEEGLTTC